MCGKYDKGVRVASRTALRNEGSSRGVCLVSRRMIIQDEKDRLAKQSSCRFFQCVSDLDGRLTRRAPYRFLGNTKHSRCMYITVGIDKNHFHRVSQT